MKKITTTFTKTGLAACALVMLLSACTTQMSESVSDSSLGANGSFEHFRNSLPLNWLVYTAKTTGEGDFDIVADESLACEGMRSIKLSVRSCSARGGRFSPGLAQELPVTAGETYHVSFCLRNKGSAFAVKINAVNATSQAPGPILSLQEEIGQWRRFDYDYKIPGGMNRLRFELNVLKPGTLWIDDVRIENRQSAATSRPVARRRPSCLNS